MIQKNGYFWRSIINQNKTAQKMKKFLLLAALAAVVQFSSAQAPTVRPQSLQNPHIQPSSNEDRPVVVLPNGGNTTSSHVVTNGHNKTTNTEKSLLNGTPLNSQAIGTSGNLLTITTFNCNQLYCNNQLNAVTFIHRSDPAVNATENIAEYNFDYSKNGGTTWKSNIGPITISNNPNITIDNNGTDPHGRFPQGLIFNPNGNTNIDSGYLVYSGTWHNEPVSGTTGNWVGQLRGRGNLNGDSTTFNVHVDTINNGITDIATGMCQSVPGIFWAVNEDFTGTFSTSSNDITRGIIVEKGVWDSIAHDVVWTASEIHQAFDSFTANSVIVSAAQSFNIAFDPTGQIGWISCIGDITNGPVDSTLNPIFWKSTDGGNTWSHAMQVPLDSLPGVTAALHALTIYTTPTGVTPGLQTSGIPTTSFESNMTVDYAGNPHFLCTVGNGGSYSIESGAGYTMYDITQNPADSACQPTWGSWAAIYIDSIATLRGNTTLDNPQLTEDNRPLVSRTVDGKRLYFFWEASDPLFALPGSSPVGDDNTLRNLFVRGFDVAHSTSTAIVNLTQGDVNWGGPTLAFPNPGNFGQANYPTVSPVVLQNGTNDIIPVVLTQIDLSGQDLSAGEAQFWYVNNISFSQFDYTNGLSATLSLIGADTVYLPKGTAYNDSGAVINYLDTLCTHSGLLHIVTNGSSLNINVPGTYFFYYAAEDANNEIYATGVRVVIVVSAPVANFSYVNIGNNTVQFYDSSLYNPTGWAWTFGDGANDNVDQNPSHQYATFGSYNVCLTASNAIGSSAPFCQTINVVNGINNIDFASSISMFPNPTSGLVNITLSGNNAIDFTVSVYNILGDQVIATSDYKAGTTNVEFNTGTLADGVYLVKINSNQGSAVKRLVVSHK
jgi:PKD repeat protein